MAASESLNIVTVCLLLFCWQVADGGDKPMTEQEKADWERMEAMVQKEINKMKAKYSGGSDTCQSKQTMNAQMLTPTPEGQDFEDVYRAQLCIQCKELGITLEKGMVSADKRKRYGRHLSDEEVVELAYKICDKKVDDFTAFCREIVQKGEAVFYERYLEGPDYGLIDKACEPYCSPNNKKVNEEL